MPVALDLSSASIVLDIAGEEYTLTAPRQEIQLTEADPDSAQHARIRLEFHRPYSKAIDLGTPGADAVVILDNVQTVLGSQLAGLGVTGALRDEWAAFKAKMEKVPVLGQLAKLQLPGAPPGAAAAAEAMLDTNVRITDIVIQFNLNKPAGEAAKFDGTFGLGLMFTPHPDHPPRLFNVKLVSFGAMLTLKLEGVANRDSLGFDWP